MSDDFDALMREATARAASETATPRYERVICPIASRNFIPAGSTTRVASTPYARRWIAERLMVSRAGSARASDGLPARGPDGHVAVLAHFIVTALFRNGAEVWRGVVDTHDTTGPDSLMATLAKHRLDVEIGDVLEIEVRNDGPDAMLYASIAGMAERAAEA